jgi:hypothetical protein
LKSQPWGHGCHVEVKARAYTYACPRADKLSGPQRRAAFSPWLVIVHKHPHRQVRKEGKAFLISLLAHTVRHPLAPIAIVSAETMPDSGSKANLAAQIAWKGFKITAGGGADISLRNNSLKAITKIKGQIFCYNNF